MASAPATAKQIAYLQYMSGKTPVPKGLTLEAASELIDSMHEQALDDPDLAERVSLWTVDRSRLHPKLYPDEAAEDARLARLEGKGRGGRVAMGFFGGIGCMGLAGIAIAVAVIGASDQAAKPGTGAVDRTDATEKTETRPAEKAETKTRPTKPEVTMPDPAKAEMTMKAPAFPTASRTWKSSDGREILARAMRFDGATVTLRRADGVEFPAVDISTLSAADQAFLRGLKTE